MKICTSTQRWTHLFSMQETLQKHAEAGFDAIDLSCMIWKKRQYSIVRIT